MQQDFDLGIFHLDKWLDLSVKDKEIQLQQLADYYTKQLKLPQKIKLEFENLTAEGRAGKYNPNNNTITINDNVLSKNRAELINDLKTMSEKDINEKWGKISFKRMESIDATIHEIRHAINSPSGMAGRKMCLFKPSSRFGRKAFLRQEGNRLLI